MTAKKKTWRDIVKVHPAADVFPLMSDDDLKTLAEDIKANGLSVPVTLWRDPQTGEYWLLDGRNRMNGLELIGWRQTILRDDGKWDGNKIRELEMGFDPYIVVLSQNLQRRHLTKAQRAQIYIRVHETR